MPDKYISEKLIVNSEKVRVATLQIDIIWIYTLTENVGTGVPDGPL